MVHGKELTLILECHSILFTIKDLSQHGLGYTTDLDSMRGGRPRHKGRGVWRRACWRGSPCTVSAGARDIWRMSRGRADTCGSRHYTCCRGNSIRTPWKTSTDHPWQAKVTNRKKIKVTHGKLLSPTAKLRFCPMANKSHPWRTKVTHGELKTLTHGELRSPFSS